ncbi:MAG: HAD family hydrolase [Nitrososphaerota archaeon]
MSLRWQRRIKLVAMDLDGTLYSSRSYVEELERAIARLLAEMLGVDVDEAVRRLVEAKSRVMTTSASLTLLGVKREVFYEKLAGMVEPSNHIQPRPELEDLLRRIKAQGVKVALHTNAGRPLALKVLKALGLSVNVFDIVVTSDEAEPKPSPRGYEYLLLSAGCRPEECVYIGDRALAELRTAKFMGMLTVKIGGRVSIWADLHAGDIVEALGKVVELIRESSEAKT